MSTCAWLGQVPGSLAAWQPGTASRDSSPSYLEVHAVYGTSYPRQVICQPPRMGFGPIVMPTVPVQYIGLHVLWVGVCVLAGIGAGIVLCAYCARYASDT
ncbi:hypothetical protein GGR52DRAFT_529242 [Hypoxylon sp. FL1284]|nr:hypothetical protein GGR52DRAFT_529242 [Hypoxylon sp. FL1284]